MNTQQDASPTGAVLQARADEQLFPREPPACSTHHTPASETATDSFKLLQTHQQPDYKAKG